MNHSFDSFVPDLNSTVSVSTKARFVSQLKQTLNHKLGRKPGFAQPSKMRKTLIIGSGHRINNNFMPAIYGNTLPLEIMGVYSRTLKHSKTCADRWGIKCLEDLNRDCIEAAEVIIISITVTAVADLLQQLYQFNLDFSQKTLVIDTPVFSGLSQIRFCPLLNKAKNVVVCEDFMNFPQFDVMRSFVNSGHIGKIKEIKLQGCGYRYHGLALARSFLQFERIDAVEKRSDGFRFTTKSGVNIHFQLPYQRLNGALHIIGENNSLVYDAHNKAMDKTHYRLRNYYENGEISGFELISPEGRSEIVGKDRVSNLQSIAGYMEEPEDEFNLFKTVGLQTVLQSIFQRNINHDYFYIQGLYDHYCYSLAEKKMPQALVQKMIAPALVISSMFSNRSVVKL